MIERKRGQQKSVQGYFTVEAAMVFPVILFLVFFVFYLLVFLYDRCMEELAIGTVALRGCTLQYAQKEEMIRQLEDQQILENMPYIAWKTGKETIVLDGNKVSVKREGELSLPSLGLLEGFDEKRWCYTASYENDRIKPVYFIRNYKSISGGK